MVHPDLITNHCFLNRIFIGYKLLSVKHVLVLEFIVTLGLPQS